MSKRVRYMDLFRGIGIILMVMGHVGFGSELPKKLTLNKLALIGEAEKSP